MLVLEYQSGSKKAVAILVKRWHRKLCRQAFWYTKDKDVAKDIAQDSWGVILQKLPSLSNSMSFGSWAMTIVSRKSVDWLRKQKKETLTFEKYHDSYDTTNTNSNPVVDANEVILKELRIAITKLPNDQKVVLNLFYLEEFTLKQISEVLHVSLGTVKSRLFYAREKLKEILKENTDEK